MVGVDGGGGGDPWVGGAGGGDEGEGCECRVEGVNEG